jgi:hypothetical protein
MAQLATHMNHTTVIPAGVLSLGAPGHQAASLRRLKCCFAWAVSILQELVKFGHTPPSILPSVSLLLHFPDPTLLHGEIANEDFSPPEVMVGVRERLRPPNGA